MAQCFATISAYDKCATTLHTIADTCRVFALPQLTFGQIGLEPIEKGNHSPTPKQSKTSAIYYLFSLFYFLFFFFNRVKVFVKITQIFF
jgi:hypothetical protein